MSLISYPPHHSTLYPADFAKTLCNVRRMLANLPTLTQAEYNQIDCEIQCRRLYPACPVRTQTRRIHISDQVIRKARFRPKRQLELSD